MGERRNLTRSRRNAAMPAACIDNVMSIASVPAAPGATVATTSAANAGQASSATTERKNKRMGPPKENAPTSRPP